MSRIIKRGYSSYKARFIFSFLLLLLSTVNTYSQVTIGSATPPDSNALLDLKQYSDESSNKGLLLPRVSLVSKALADPLKNHVKGMFVYNIADVDSEIYPGCYYNDGTKWTRIETNSNSGMTASVTNGLNITGNTIKLGGTLIEPTDISGISSTNKLSFIGTGVDAINFDSNTLSIDAANNRVGIGTSIPDRTLHVNGTVRITGHSGTPTRLVGRDAPGDISEVKVGDGLRLSQGELTATIGSISNGLKLVNNTIKLGGALIEPTAISGISSTNKLSFTGIGVDAISFDSNTLSIDATNHRVGIGTNAPTKTLDVAGTVRIRTFTGTPTQLIGSNLTGDISKITLGNGLSLSNGVLTTTAGTSTISASNGLNFLGNAVKLGGDLTGPTTISGISSANKLTFVGTGIDAINFNNNSLSVDATNNRVGIGTNTPDRTLHVNGTVRITGHSGTPTRLVGRDAPGDISEVKIGNGLRLSQGELTATAGTSTIINAYLISFKIQSYNVGSQTTPIKPLSDDYTVWVSGTPNVPSGKPHVLLPITTKGRVINVVAAAGELRVGAAGLSGGDGWITSANGDNLNIFIVPNKKRASFQYIRDEWDKAQGTWIVMMKDF